MKLDHFTLLGFEPYYIPYVGKIKSIKLEEIDKLQGRFIEYSTYLSILLLNTKNYYELIDKTVENKDMDDYFVGYTIEEKDNVLTIRNEYESLTYDDKCKISFFSLAVYDRKIIDYIQKTLSFFIEDIIEYDCENQIFYTYDGTKDKDDKLVRTGMISNQNYDDVVDIILQRHNVSINTEKDETDLSKVKNKKGLEIFKRLQKGKKEFDKNKSVDKNTDLSNIISAVSVKSKNLNIITIWKITVYQLYEQFSRIHLNHMDKIQSTSVAYWGDKDNKYDSTQWYKNLHEN